MTEFDNAVRMSVYRRFVETGEAPGVDDVSRELDCPPDEVEAAFDRLSAERVLVLKPGTRKIRMAMPLSAVETPFRVHVGKQSYWAPCIWDALGIPAMLGADARIATHYEEFEDPPDLRVTDGRLSWTDGVIHFAVPAARWWDNIGYT